MKFSWSKFFVFTWENGTLAILFKAPKFHLIQMVDVIWLLKTPIWYRCRNSFIYFDLAQIAFGMLFFLFWDFLFLFWNLFRFCCSSLFIFHDIFHLHGTYVSTLVGYLMHEQRYFANVIPCCCCFFFCLFSFIESVVYVVFFIAVPFILQVNIFHS